MICSLTLAWLGYVKFVDDTTTFTLMRFEYDCTLNVDLVYLFIPSGRLLVGSNLPYLYFGGNFNRSINRFAPIWPHLRCDVGLEEGEY